MLGDWLAWREREIAELREEREDAGLDPDGGRGAVVDGVAMAMAAGAAGEVNGEKAAQATEKEDGAGAKVVEEIVEEVLDETEEIV